jgi:hypothetical protein
LNGKGASWMVVGIGSSSAYLRPPAAGDPCNKVDHATTQRHEQRQIGREDRKRR